MPSHECTRAEVIDMIKKDIENLSSMKDVVIELKTLVAIQSEQFKKQSDLLQTLTASVNQQSEVLTKLSDKYEELDNKFEQRTIENLKENSISIGEIFKMIIDKALPPIIVAGLTYFVLEIVKK